MSRTKEITQPIPDILAVKLQLSLEKIQLQVAKRTETINDVHVRATTSNFSGCHLEIQLPQPEHVTLPQIERELRSTVKAVIKNYLESTNLEQNYAVTFSFGLLDKASTKTATR